jgi:chemotaxis protein MotA
MKSSLLGVVLAIVLTVGAIFFTTTNYIIYLDLISISIVLGGTISASIITFGVSDLVQIFKVVIKVFFKPIESPLVSINQLITISSELNRNPAAINSLINDKKLHPFVIDGLKLIQNDFERAQIKTIMEASLNERKNHHQHQVEILKTLAKYPPAFGMIGTVIGLVAILQGLGSTAGVDTIGPNMAVALITTLYGLFIANYCFIPLSDNLLHRLEYMMRERKMIIKGILLIKEKEDPIFIQEMLGAHLLPVERAKIQNVSFA